MPAFHRPMPRNCAASARRLFDRFWRTNRHRVKRSGWSRVSRATPVSGCEKL